MRVNPELLRAVKEIMPSDEWQINRVKQLKQKLYKVYAEDTEYHYEIEIELITRADEESRGYRLLDFDYREKA